MTGLATAVAYLIALGLLVAAMAVDAGRAAREAQIVRLHARIAELNTQVAKAREDGYALRTAANFRDSRDAGYIDLTGLERP